MSNTKEESYPLLEAKGISHNFDYPLFKDVALTLNPCESIAIIGASGTGKSTLLNIFSTLLIPDKGEVYYNNNTIFSMSNKEQLKIRREHFGIIFQSHYLFRGFTASENIKISELLCDSTIDESLLEKLNISHVMKQNIGSLSGGQQQRLSCARVLTKKPKVIFADEPTGNLDTQTADELIGVLFEYVKSNNAGMLIVTHENDIAFQCDHVYKLNNLTLEKVK